MIAPLATGENVLHLLDSDYCFLLLSFLDLFGRMLAIHDGESVQSKKTCLDVRNGHNLLTWMSHRFCPFNHHWVWGPLKSQPCAIGSRLGDFPTMGAIKRDQPAKIHSFGEGTGTLW